RLVFLSSYLPCAYFLLFLLRPLSLHDALPICLVLTLTGRPPAFAAWISSDATSGRPIRPQPLPSPATLWTGQPILMSSPLKPASDRKSTRLNSSHVSISYAVFCLNNKRESIHT